MPTAEDAGSLDPSRSWLRHWPKLALLIALGLHAWLVSANWSSRFLAGHEFRQGQTALSAFFIAHDQDYSLAYPTPLFGPPWSIPMEFPLYQWATAWLSNKMHWSIVESARALNLACFYLTLPAVFLVLRRLRPSAVEGRWLALACMLCSPVYIFYTRAVLIESMALMFCAWFLWAFVLMCQRCSWSWAVLASALGALAALVKVTTFMAWAGGAAVAGVWWSWQQWRTQGWAAWRKSVALGTISAVLPGVLTLWWVRTADAIKEMSVGGRWLQSENLKTFNLGTVADRTDVGELIKTGKNAFQVVSPFWVVAAISIGAVALAVRKRERAPLMGMLWFTAIPYGFPVLYLFHDYYFYANAAIFLSVMGLVLGTLASGSHRWRWIAPIALVVICGAQLRGYFQDYRESQLVVSPGGSIITALIKEKIPEDQVIVVLGEDWSAATPFYAERHAFMIRNEIAIDPAETIRQMSSLDTERVAGLLATRDKREFRPLIDALTATLNLESTPSISDGESDFYLHNDQRGVILFALKQDPNYSFLAVDQSNDADSTAMTLVTDESFQEVTPQLAETLFSFCSPRPHHYRAMFPFEAVKIGNAFTLTAHPDAEIWTKVPAGAKEVEIQFGLRPESYQRDGDHTDGVQFLVWGIDDVGTQTVLFERTLRPAKFEADQGTASAKFALPDQRPVHIAFVTRPSNTYSFDWAYWAKMTVR